MVDDASSGLCRRGADEESEPADATVPAEEGTDQLENGAPIEEPGTEPVAEDTQTQT